MAITKVTTDVITALAVTAPKLAANAVTTDKLADNAVTAAKIAAGALGDQVAGITSSASATTIAGTLTSTGTITGTLATAAQAAITSVGTLTSLAITGDLDIADTGAGAITVGGTTNTYNFPVVINATDAGLAISDGTKTIGIWGGHGGSSHAGSGIGTRSNHDMFIATNDTKRMVFDTSGKVGIGETVPLGFLHVKNGDSGQGSVNAAGNSLVLESNGATGITFLSGSSSNTSIIMGDSESNYQGVIIYDHSVNAFKFATTGTERMRIDSAGTIYQGHTTPTLHSAVRGIVFENGALTNDVTRGAGKSITLSQNVAVDAGNTWAYLATDEASYYQQFGGNHYFATCASGSAGADATLTSKMTILNGGNVGIGTTAPSDTLDLAANGSMGLGIWKSPDGTLRAAQKVMYVGTGSSGSNSGSSGGNEHGIIQMFHAGDEDIRLYTQGNSWINGGNLGVGTASPSAKLHVYTAGAEGINIGIQNSERYYNIETDGGNLMFKDVSAGSITRLQIGSNGTIQLGNPVTGAAQDVVIMPNSKLYLDAGGDTYISEDAANQMAFFTGGAKRFALIGGAGFFSGTVTASHSFSDERLKENITVIPNALDKIKTLRGITFTRKSDGSSGTGLIAQELEKVLPDAVYETKTMSDDDDTEYKAITYEVTVGLLVEGIKEQQTIIDDLKARIKTLEE